MHSITNETFFNELGQRFVVPGSVFGVSDSERQSLNYGLSLKGKISTDWSIDTTASYYDAFKDRTVSSNLNPNNPFNQNKGQVSDVDAWWAAYDLKLATDNFLGRDDLSFMSGYQFSHASLNLDVYNSNNYKGGSADIQTTDSGGATQTNSAFSQLEWRFLPDWSVMAGGKIRLLASYEWDRIPRLQANASVTYHILPVWDGAIAVRYRSDAFQRLDNTDTAAHVMGGTDEATFVDLKTSYQLPINPKLKSTISAGIDNVFDYNAFENHPYPQSTYFVKASLKY